VAPFDIDDLRARGFVGFVPRDELDPEPSRGRIGLLVQFARGDAVIHYGGRLLWQVERCERLLVALVEDAAYADREAALMDDFIKTYGRLPFANLRREHVRA
jgi:hypothetical protein